MCGKIALVSLTCLVSAVNGRRLQALSETASTGSMTWSLPMGNVVGRIAPVKLVDTKSSSQNAATTRGMRHRSSAYRRRDSYSGRPSMLLDFIKESQQPPPPMQRARVVKTFFHDPEAFTQGLYYEPYTQTMLESTGLYGRSTVRRVHIESGKVLFQKKLLKHHFGEGIAVSKGRIVQLLWREGRCLLRDPVTFEMLLEAPLPKGMREGWGLTCNKTSGELYASDGSSTLFVLDGDTLEVTRRITVRAAGRTVSDINDLELVRGEIWANIWHRDEVAIIDPRTGNVRRFVDLSDLLSKEERRKLELKMCGEAVLNGIAWDETGDRIFVTGKCWPKLFQVELN